MKVAFLSCLLACMIAAALSESLSIVSELSGDHEIKGLGESARLPCTVVGEGYDSWNNAIIWSKITAEGEQVINNNAAVNQPFLSTGRYAMDRTTEAGTVRIILNINDITVADGGRYKCILKAGSKVLSQMEYEIVVPAPIESLTLSSNKSRTVQEGNETHTIFDFEKLKPAYVGCVSKGGHPMPSLKMYRGRVEVTDEFQHDIIETKTGEIGLEEVHYEIRLEKGDFLASSDYSGHNLKCVSKVPKSGKSDKMVHKQTRVATMEVTFPPEFDCSSEWAAFIDTEQFAIQCSVHANPQVDLDALSWHVGDINNGTEVAMGNSVDGLSANMSVDHATSKVKVSLTIDQVNDTHFQNYVLKAKNELGERHFYAKLSLATTTLSTSTTTRSPNAIENGNNPPYKADESRGVTGGSERPGASHWAVVVSVMVIGVVGQLIRGL